MRSLVGICALQSALKIYLKGDILVVIIHEKFHKKFIHNFLSYPDYRQTHSQTII